MSSFSTSVWLIFAGNGKIVDEWVRLNPPTGHETSALMGNNINHLKKTFSSQL